MKHGVILGSVVAVGVFSGSCMLKSIDFDVSIFEKLLSEGEGVIDSVGDKDDDIWLALAQKYRENGASKWKQNRDFSKRQNPGFLSEEFWKKISELQDTTTTTTNGNIKLDFSKDEEIAKELKKACREALKKPYDKNLFDNVKNWCRLHISDEAKELLKFQKENGNCRIWFVASTSDKEGLFIWEADGGSNRKWFVSDFLENINNTGESEKITKIKEDCKSKTNNVLALAADTDSNGKRIWRVHYHPELLTNYRLA